MCGCVYIRGRTARSGALWSRTYNAAYVQSVEKLRNSLNKNDFDSAWADGEALSTEEAISFAQRGRGERRRASSGWDALTPAELDVVQLVCEGLGNKDIAPRLFISPRTVQAHLTHVYNKLGLTSRIQLAQEATLHT
jgi:DNA-binding NarL/FixJ family response regulator